MNTIFLIIVMNLCSLGIGALAARLYYLNKYENQPIDWYVIALSFALTMAICGALMRGTI